MEERHPPVIAPIYLGSVPPLLAPESLITTRTISKYLLIVLVVIRDSGATMQKNISKHVIGTLECLCAHL
jgi:hypothetical protein